MNIFYPANHHLHHPPYEIFNGEKTHNPEIPARLEAILSTLENSHHTLNQIAPPTDRTELLRYLSQIHDHDYLNWLQSCQVTEPLFPSVFNAGQAFRQSGHTSIQWGNFVTDLFTPLMPAAWQIASTTAQTVMVATQSLLSNHETVMVAGRPPGHHAGRRRVGGYCYLNNAALAAQILSERGKVAILDVDYHHGNGTQDIFYNRNDVVTCSIHAHPERKFPYFAGFADETGNGNGNGYNKNYPLAANIDDHNYQLVLQEAIAWIKSHSISFLVIALGVDTHQSDPICDFALSTQYYRKMAESIATLGVPTLITLEGGYNNGVIGENINQFLSGWQ